MNHKLLTSLAAPLRARAFKTVNFALVAVVVTLLAGVLSACSRGDTEPLGAAPPAPSVRVAAVVTRQVTDWDEFTGRFEAVERVDLRPRVSGYIDRIEYSEGKEVRKGDLLFSIDARSYEAELKRVQAEVARVESQRSLSDSELTRARKLVELRALSREEFDARVSRLSQSDAELKAARAAVETAQLNLSFTRVTAPVAGRVSRANVTAGNFVTAGTTVLTTLVSLDPIYVSFETDEQAYLKYMRLARSGELASSRDAPNEVAIGLANESGYPHAGKMNFVDNALDPATGTIRGRAVLANGERLFTPGLFARVRLPGSASHQALLINDEAIMSDQDRKYVMVVDRDDVIEYRQVQLGAVAEDLRIVREGLAAGERVVVSGQQRVRPGIKVTPQPAEEDHPQAVASTAVPRS